MDIKVGDVVQIDNSWYGTVLEVFNGDEVRKTRYRVSPLSQWRLNAERWVDYNRVVSYDSLKAAFGPIDSIEKEISK
jgi:hypothetical protein